MSILLEALRKSEKGQRSREVPTIHSEVLSTPASRSLRTGFLTVLLVLTLIVCGWLVWNQYRQPTDVEQVTTAEQVVADTGDGSNAAVDTSPATSPVEGRPDTNTAEFNSQVSSGERGQKGESKDTTGDTGARTPMELFKAAEQERTNSARLAEKAATRAKPRTFTSNDGSFPNANTADGSDNTANAGRAAPDKPYQPDAPELLGYWDLPDSIRANVPDITFSVLVYDKNPENRFVLINGERLTEGDAHQPGLIVKEIRRDGVVFSYRLYQFLIEN